MFLQGTSRDKGRWQKCVDYVNDKMGMAVGRLFIRENFRQRSKEVVSGHIWRQAAYARIWLTFLCGVCI